MPTVKEEKPIGKVVHFFPNISVVIVKLDTGSVKIGDTLKFVYHDETLEQTVHSMQVEHKDIKEAKKGQEFGVKTDKPVHEHALVYKSKA